MTGESFDIAGRLVRVVRRPRMKSMRMRMRDDGSLTVSAAKGVPLAEIRDFVEGNAAWIERQAKKVETSPLFQAEHANDAEKREWRAVVEAGTRVLLARWEPVIGVRVKKLAFRNMKSRWGSCQPLTGRVCINTRLALYPPDCLEYVVVHELVHMLEPSHNARFHALMDKFLPDWKQRRKMLR